MLDPELIKEYNESRSTVNDGVFCHAPFTSLNFAQNGDVTVCCYNRSHKIGRYPDQSLHDMWFGAAADDMRTAMSGLSLPAGCELCHDQFTNRNFAGLRARFYDVLAEPEYPTEEGRLQSMPKVIELEISNTCNLECTMCNGYYSSLIRRRREHLPPLVSPYDDTFVEQLREFVPHLTQMRFLGGEPFLIKPYFRIWESIVELNPSMEVSITTNGTRLDDRIKDLLEKMNCHIIVSADALDRETFEAIRINADYDTVMGNIPWFRDYTRRKGTGMNIAVCPTRQNWRVIPDILAFCNEHDIRLGFNTVVNPIHLALRAMSHRELVRVVEHLEDGARFLDDTFSRRFTRTNYTGLLEQLRGCRDARAAFVDSAAMLVPTGASRLATFDGATARMERVETDPEIVRLELEPSEERVPWHVQLNMGPFPVRRNLRYQLTLRLRADEARPIDVGISMAEGPWEGLGFARVVELSSAWRHVVFDIAVDRDFENARLHFDVGSTGAAVEIAELELRRVPSEVLSDRVALDGDDPRF